MSGSVVNLIGVYALSTVVSPSGNGGIEGGGGFRRWDEKSGRPSGVWRGGGQAGAGRTGDARMSLRQGTNGETLSVLKGDRGFGDTCVGESARRGSGGQFCSKELGNLGTAVTSEGEHDGSESGSGVVVTSSVDVNHWLVVAACCEQQIESVASGDSANGESARFCGRAGTVEFGAAASGRGRTGTRGGVDSRDAISSAGE